MDNPANGAYLESMFTRAVVMLAMLVLALAAPSASAHMDGLNTAPDQAAHAVWMAPAPHGDAVPCDDDGRCDAADAAMCEFICAGLSVFPPAPVGAAEFGLSPDDRGRLSPERRAGLAPDLNERPPRPRLL